MVRWLLVAALVAAPVAVQAKGDDDAGKESGRTLNGHPFLPMATVGSPFVNNEYVASTAVGIANLNLNESDLSTNGLSKSDVTGGDDVRLGFMNTGFGAQISIIDLLALRLAVRGNLRTGINGTSAYLLGANAGPDFSAGATAKVLHLDFLQLGIGVDVLRTVEWQISPAQLLNAAIENFQQTGQFNIPRDAAYVQTDTLSIVPGLAFAVAPAPYVGFQGSLALSVNSTQVKGQRTQSDSAFVGGLGISGNFQPVGVPIGVLAALSRNFGSDSTRASTTFEFGFFPVALSHFSLGIEAYYNDQELDPIPVSDENGQQVGEIRNSVSTLAGQVIMLYAR